MLFFVLEKWWYNVLVFRNSRNPRHKMKKMSTLLTQQSVLETKRCWVGSARRERTWLSVKCHRNDKWSKLFPVQKLPKCSFSQKCGIEILAQFGGDWLFYYSCKSCQVCTAQLFKNNKTMRITALQCVFEPFFRSFILVFLWIYGTAEQVMLAYSRFFW